MCVGDMPELGKEDSNVFREAQHPPNQTGWKHVLIYGSVDDNMSLEMTNIRVYAVAISYKNV
jgi:hypothetical protein